MTVVLLLMGGVALLLVNNNQSKALDLRLAATLADADDVGDPPPGSYLARPRRDGTVEVTPGAPGPVSDLLTATLRAPQSAAAPAGHDLGDLPRVGSYRVRTGTQPGGKRWAIAGDLAALRSDQQDVLQAVLLAEVAGVAGAVAAAALLSRRSVEPLARALELQRRFVADASHELRAPLTVLHTRAQILAADPRVDSASAVGKSLRGLVEDTRALGEVIEDLLASAELDRHPRRMQLVDLNDVAAAVLQSTSAHGHSVGVTLSHRAGGPGRLLVTGHPTALRRAVTALVDNAIRHTPAGGQVHISTADLGDRIELVVADSGVGLDLVHAETLFVRSYHHDHGFGELGGPHFGLGLALVRETAAAHGGSVTATGTPGEGARFTLVLPRVEDLSLREAESNP
jgi:signal transduction histidine kinase